MAMLSPIAGVTAGALGALALNKTGKGMTSFLDLLNLGNNQPTATADANASANGDQGSPSIEGVTLSKNSQALLEQLKRAVQTRCAAAGISLGQPIHLEEDGLGEVVADIEHPDHQKIEQLFQNDPELAGLFRQVRASITADTAASSVPAEGRFGMTISGDQVAIDFTA